MTDPLLAGASYLVGDPGCLFRNNTVTCTFGTLAGNGSFSTRMFSVTPTTPGMVTNTASATSSVTDDNPNDNSDTVMTPVSMAVYDLAASSTGEGFSCPPGPNPTKQVCTLSHDISLLNNASPWLTGDLALTSRCQKVGTPKVQCKLAGEFTPGMYNGLGFPANQVTVYLSTDSSVDPADTRIASAPSTVLALLARHHRPVRINYRDQPFQGRKL